METGDLPLRSFSVEGYRGIRSLTLPELGRVNLFVGRNNAGKSSLLEALQLFAHRNSDAFSGILLHLLLQHFDFRPALPQRGVEVDAAAVQRVTDAVEGLFHGAFGDAPLAPIVLAAPAKHERYLEINLPWTTDSLSIGGRRRPAAIDVAEADLECSSEGGSLVLPLAVLARMVPLVSTDASPQATLIEATGLDPVRTREMWDELVIGGHHKQVEDACRVSLPDLERIVVVGEAGRRVVLCKLAGVARPVPINSMGDGVNRVFELSVALVHAKGGIALIDEVENGLHHTVQADVWDFIFSKAEALDIQVFATTHSWDAVVGFQDAANRSAAKGMLYRLEREDDGSIYVERYSERDVAIAAEQSIEVR